MASGRLVDLTLKCLPCGRLGRDPVLGGECECGASNWVETGPHAQIAPARRVEGRLVDLTFKCLVCGRCGRDPDLAGDCECGASNWVETAPRPLAARWFPPVVLSAQRARLVAPGAAPQPPPLSDGFVDGSEIANAIVDDFTGARLNELLGGVMRGARILIAGRAGADKSTATAELAAFAAEHWARPEAGRLRRPGCKIYWLDADQKDASLVRTLFQTAEVDHVFAERGRVRLLPKRRTPFTYLEALAMVPRDARVLVMDSLETWGRGGYKNQLDVMLALGDHPAMLKVMIAGTNKQGSVSGLEDVARADDATIYAERTDDDRYLLRFDKRRWRPCDTARARGAGKIHPPAPPPPVQPPGPRPAPAQVSPVGALPDFSRDFVAMAASTWGTREVERYKAELRAQGVPNDSIEGWFAALCEARETNDVESTEPRRLIH